jgi:hypothetical protein
VAWLSDSADDAYCRIHGETGKKAANCGQATLPAAAGPWVRTDGAPFAGSITEMLSPTYEILNPLLIDELGDTVGIESLQNAFTGTQGTGRATLYETCSDWTSTSGFVLSGIIGRTGVSWTQAASASCEGGGYQHLYCLQQGEGPALPAMAPQGALAFHTSTTGLGDLSTWDGAEGPTALDMADAICQKRAEAGSLPHPESFKAWLSDSTADPIPVDAVDRFTYDGPWVRRDGVIVAESKDDLVNDVLLSPICQTETGGYAPETSAWTGTLASGLSSGSDCSGWTATSGSGSWGHSTAITSSWTEHLEGDCGGTSRSLYCLSERFVVFFDGFESGDTSAWSSATP